MAALEAFDPLVAGPAGDALDALARDVAPRFLIALSGGGDSMALAGLVRRWSQTRGRGAHPALASCTVDHALRDGSGLEASQAAAMARAIGLDANLVRREGPRPLQGLQESARTARHLLLAQAAAARGMPVVLVAHTREDQAETVAFRMTRGTGLPGLAGMAGLSPSPAWRSVPGVLVARPLLADGRDALRQTLRAAGMDWIEDPSNSNTRFSRIAVRQRLAALAGAEADVSALNRIAGLAGTLRAARMQALRALLGDPARVRIDPDKVGAAVTGELFAEPPGAALVAALAFAAGGADRPPPEARAAALARRLSGPSPAGGTLGGARFAPAPRGWISVRPAPPRSRLQGGQRAMSRPAIDPAGFRRALAVASDDPVGFLQLSDADVAITDGSG